MFLHDRYAGTKNAERDDGGKLRKRELAVRAPWEQDLGRACRYATNDDRYPLPTVLIGKNGFKSLQLRKGRARGSVADKQGNVNPIWQMAPDTRVNGKGGNAARWADLRELVSKTEADEAPNMSAYYRKWFEPVQNGSQAHFDTHANDEGIGTWRNNPRRFLLTGRPQIGKTGAFLWLVHLL